jgi:hypothetical protein
MTCVTQSVMDGGYGRVARRESKTCSAWRSMATVVGKEGCVSSSRRQPGGNGLCNIGGVTNGGSSGGGGSIGGASASERLLFATAPQRISKLVPVAVLTSQNRFPCWRPCGRKQFSILAWQAWKQFSVLAILAGVVMLATKTVFLFGTSETVFCFGNSILTSNNNNNNNKDSVVGRVNGRIWLGLTHQPEPYPSHLLV